MRQVSYRAAFTLIELLAVVLVILLLAGITLSTSGYIQKRMAIASAKTQIAALEAALEAYKSDWGYYPATSPCRLSASYFCESTNNWILFQALSGASGGKKYLRFTPNQVRLNPAAVSNILTGATTTQGGLTNICDPWGTPFNYFNSPSTTFSNVNPCTSTRNMGRTLGGQVNVSSFDLWSYGPDHFTSVPGGAFIMNPGCGFNIYPWYNENWTKPAAALDDVTSFAK